MKKKPCGALLNDLSKVFDCVSHELLIAKLHAYGFDKSSLELVHSYLSDRKQRVRIENTFSSWFEISHGVPQGSILGPLLFNIYICDIFMFIGNIDMMSYADDNTPFLVGRESEIVISELSTITKTIFNWFENNGMKANPDKCHLIVTENDNFQIEHDNFLIENSVCEKILGVKVDNKLTFKNHVETLCKKASQKISALSRVSSYMNFYQKKLIVNAFITSHFSYCPLIWMFHSRKLNNCINRIHERALRIIYDDYESSFRDLLNMDNSSTIHERNLKKLALEIFKVKNGYAPEMMKDIFVIEEPCYNLRNDLKFKSYPIHSVQYGIQTLRFVAPKIWNSIPSECKNASSVYEFKRKISMWTPSNCPCRICKTYIPQLGFID